MPPAEVYLLATFGIALLAAIFDWWTGRIPDVLTVGALLVALPLHAWLSSPGRLNEGLESAFLGALACAVPCFVGWKLGWVGGGDVKLVTAMGAMGGMGSGLESVFLSLFFALAFVFVRLSWRGVFFRTLGNGVAVVATTAIGQKERVSAGAELTTTLRFGPFALAGAAVSLVLHGGLV